jgi:hypothetical protein
MLYDKLSTALNTSRRSPKTDKRKRLELINLGDGQERCRIKFSWGMSESCRRGPLSAGPHSGRSRINKEYSICVESLGPTHTGD